MTDFAKYSLHYLRQWDERASVRSRQRTRLTAETAALLMFPAHMMPVLKHAALASLGDAARHEYSVRMACDFQLGVASVELDPVVDLCAKLASRGMDIVLPEPARQVVLTIAADEAYHALLAREFVSDAERFTGVAVADQDRSNDPLAKALAYVRQAAPADLARQAETMVLCFAENFVTGELFGLTEDGASDTPFQITLREHLVDEGRHQVFFQNLLRHLWAGIDEDARIALGRLLPGFLDAFLIDRQALLESQARLLSPMGFDLESSQRIIMEASRAAFGPPPPEKYKQFIARNSLKLRATTGIAKHPATREVLVGSGWSAP